VNSGLVIASQIFCASALMKTWYTCVANAVLAVVLVVSTRGRLGREPERAAPRKAAEVGALARPGVQ
jgi:hypothetical protein